MALKTLGTAATTTLAALAWNAQANQANVAQIAANILNDQNVAHPIFPGAFQHNGTLYIPNRGMVRLLPGDYVAYDSTGWPIILSAGSAGSASWVHS